MPPRFGWRVAAALLPLGTGILGLLNGLSDWRHASSLLQQIAAICVNLTGPLGVLAAGALLSGHTLRTPLLRSWAVVVMLTSGVSSVAWGAPAVEMTLRAEISMTLMALVAGISTGLFCVLVFWLAQMAFPAPSPDPAP